MRHRERSGTNLVFTSVVSPVAAARGRQLWGAAARPAAVAHFADANARFGLGPETRRPFSLPLFAHFSSLFCWCYTTTTVTSPAAL
jgi:hypothetical protein